MYCVADILYIAIILATRPIIRFTLVALSEMSQLFFMMTRKFGTKCHVSVRMNANTFGDPLTTTYLTVT